MAQIEEGECIYKDFPEPGKYFENTFSYFTEFTFIAEIHLTIGEKSGIIYRNLAVK